MNAVIRSTTHSEPQPYVHKLRLEVRDGATVEIRRAAPLTQGGAGLIVRLIGVAVAAAALLAVLGNRIFA
jgi:hypothetical protein